MVEQEEGSHSLRNPLILYHFWPETQIQKKLDVDYLWHDVFTINITAIRLTTIFNCDYDAETASFLAVATGTDL